MITTDRNPYHVRYPSRSNKYSRIGMDRVFFAQLTSTTFSAQFKIGFFMIFQNPCHVARQLNKAQLATSRKFTFMCRNYCLLISSTVFKNQKRCDVSTERSPITIPSPWRIAQVCPPRCFCGLDFF